MVPGRCFTLTCATRGGKTSHHLEVFWLDSSNALFRTHRIAFIGPRFMNLQTFPPQTTSESNGTPAFDLFSNCSAHIIYPWGPRDSDVTRLSTQRPITSASPMPDYLDKTEQVWRDASAPLGVCNRASTFFKHRTARGHSSQGPPKTLCQSIRQKHGFERVLFHKPRPSRTARSQLLLGLCIASLTCLVLSVNCSAHPACIYYMPRRDSDATSASPMPD
ncbi:hypothetical protein FB45DRAFT_445743 [Roridomyces roridus]|uniref:Uncharacterized protein n=1 Tax=Roridomyces roridus TaxID=1738132 RepID=A0AAD7C180_9AGAR|nr:hypothetical protein FB45DRAFT_445743 [Roridomyces roridus]